MIVGCQGIYLSYNNLSKQEVISNYVHHAGYIYQKESTK